MRLLDKLALRFAPQELTRTRIGLALAVAVAADALQVASLPVAWALLPEIIDVVAMLLTVLLLGFHVLLLPTFVVELIPLVDMLPTWTGCVAAVIALRKRAQPTSTSIVTAPPKEIGDGSKLPPGN